MKSLGAVQAALWASSVCFSSCGLRALSRPVVGALSAGRFRMAAIGRRDLVLSVAGAFSHGEPGDAVGWGIVGLGDVCAVKAGPAFVKAEGSALVAVMRRTPGAAEVWAKRNVPGGNCRGYSDLDAFLAAVQGAPPLSAAAATQAHRRAHAAQEPQQQRRQARSARARVGRLPPWRRPPCARPRARSRLLPAASLALC